ncbi:MAG: choloylglycine hydrolase family protein [Desulfarculaceae bacterium]|nr:choloylglycine hydrolase family protein [Desulfarculaceae bacterium]
MRRNISTILLSIACLAMAALASLPAEACTGIRLKAKDGATVYGRSMEWGAFDLESRVAIVPKGYAFVGTTPQGLNGKRWVAKYGFVALDMVHRDVFADGMNQAGLTAGLFYHPGFAVYPKYDPAKSKDTITAADVVAFVLSQCAGVDQAVAALKKVRVVAVMEPAIGKPVEAHWMFTEPSGKAVVIEFHEGRMKVFDSPLAVITNAPTYDWHTTNLRNYINLSPVGIPGKKLADEDFTPLGHGSGMIGLPGDFTPPSRFIRAVAWTQTHRPLPDGPEAIYELFRILDNFNVPLGSGEGGSTKASKGMRSSTIWTSGWDTRNKLLYFHTQNDRRVRRLKMDKLDFSGNKIVHLPMDRKKEQDYKDITPAK